MSKLNLLDAWSNRARKFFAGNSTQRFLRVGQAAALTVMFVVGISAGCGSTSKSVQPAAKITQLTAGTVQIYDFGTVKLHAYNTNDALGDQSYLLETDTALIGIEAPAFKNNLAEYIDYIARLGKPMAGILVSSHPTGGDTELYKNTPVYATAKAKAAIDDGSVKAITDGLANTFGDAFNGNYAKITDVINPGTTSIGGMDFIITENGDVYDIEIPAINCVYTHMMGSNVHNILAGAGHIDAMIAQMKSYQNKGIYLVLTGHYPPEKIDKVAEKIAYLETAKKLINTSANANEFITAMKAAFPEYLGENYLEMSAGMIAFE
jgi:hypothetical protein